MLVVVDGFLKPSVARLFNKFVKIGVIILCSAFQIYEIFEKAIVLVKFLAMRTILRLVILFFIGIALFNCGGEQKKSANSLPNHVIFDVPALVDKDIDAIRKELGKPAETELLEPTKQQMNMGFNTWDNSYTKEGYTLLITYNPQTRKVTEFFVATLSPSGTTADISGLAQICNLDARSQKYTYQGVPSIKNPTVFTGITIRPKR